MTMVGSEFSHYRILRQLGAGGMGTVYHALDSDLGRPVAIKFLRPEFAVQSDRRERFLKEARAAAALTHPGICTIHEVGRLDDELFIVMQLVDGSTLAERIASGPLDAETVGKIALQLADALGEAHARGIVHRDLKPSNIMVNQNQGVTVLDFGLAAMLTDQVQADVSTITNQPLTHPGHAAGTIGYMAPEQIRGGPVGAPADVFALGATLYEAATGRNPFRRAGNLQTIAAMLDDYPLPIRSTVADFPAYLDGIILKCLEKRPEARYPDGNALSTALRESAFVQPSPRLSPRHRSLAVLPFTNPQGDQDDEYLSDGLTTEIITKLARLKGLLVISRSTTQKYRGSRLDSLQVGGELDVQAVLEGRISKRAQRLRITVQLLEVATGYCVWGDSYDFDVDDLFHIQEEVSRRVARALRTKFPAARTPAAAAADASPEAHRLHLQGKALFYRFNRTDNLLAIEAFRRALKIDPRYAAAHASLASACMARLEREWETDEGRWIAEALEACERAIAYDAWSSEAYSARGLVFVRQQRLDEAEAEFQRALAINPNDDIAHSMLGRIRFERGDLHQAARAFKRALKISPDYVWCWNDLAWLQWLLGRADETGRALTRVLAINPVDEIARVGIATGHYFSGELDQAVAVAQKSLEINPNHPFPRPVLAVALARRGQVTEAVTHCREILAERPGDFLTSAALGVVYAIADDAENLQLANERALALRAPRAPLNVNIAVHYTFLNRADYARLWLAKAGREGFRTDIVLKHNPLLRQFALEFPGGARSRTEADR
jgi:serine/threonine protein kinase/tetratricopeptide (TPR) repeat protein